MRRQKPSRKLIISESTGAKLEEASDEDLIQILQFPVRKLRLLQRGSEECPETKAVNSKNSRLIIRMKVSLSNGFLSVLRTRIYHN